MPVRSAGAPLFNDAPLKSDAPYAVKLPVFEGPLDLLLYLIEREELDITKVSLAQVTDQYLAYLNSLEQLEVDNLADFLVIAAKLILFKSQALLPRPPLESEEEEDVGDDLVRQLLAYKRFKEVACALDLRQESGLCSFVRLAPPPKIDVSSVDLSEVSVADLLAAVRNALAAALPDQPVGALLQPLVVTVRDQIAMIERLLQSLPQLNFVRMLSRCASRVEIIVTFLAVLELLKRQQISVAQEGLFGQIVIMAARPAERVGEDEDEDSGLLE
ncbi:MAG: segregation/condensation protein A [Thermoflexales bacterium]|nr:segregation/condensation protein A [Thermoflexales bacterium]